MKKLLPFAVFFLSAPASADVVITMKDGVTQIPSGLLRALSGQRFEVKNAWNEPHMTLQSLPKDVWQRARRQPAMAILVRGELALESGLPAGVERIEDNVSLSEIEPFDRYKFDPVKCDGVIYGFGHYSTAAQELTQEMPCDNFALRPRGDLRYRVVVEAATPKTLEVYEHGDLIASGERQLEVDFTFGYRQKYLIVKGMPGAYKLSVYPVAANIKKEKLLSLALAHDFSNAYGFGVPHFGKLAPVDAPKSKWVGAGMMAAEKFWQKGFTGKGIKVAVIDTGIDTNHPFLKDHIAGGYTPFGKGTSPADYHDRQGHGTHVAGIVRQVAPDAELLAVRVFPNEEGKGEAATLEVVAEGIRWAIDNGAHVINLSLGGGSAPSSFQKVFEYGASKGVLFAMASGNERSFDPLIPAAYSGSIQGLGFSVGATDKDLNMAVFSNYSGNNLSMKHIASHGSGVVSAAVDETGFVSMSGTSMASPQIAGVLALYKQAYPQLSSVELIKLIAAHVQRAAVND